MNTYLVDTNIVIWVLRGASPYVETLRRLEEESILSISTLTIAEVYKNAYPTELLRTEGVLEQFKSWDVTDTIGKQGGLYWQRYGKLFKTLSILDCLIAATAAEHDLTLLTLNIRHFPMDDIKVIDPLKIS